eukprot:904244-Pleurochrysis_carterae.AAC.1
MSGLRARVKVGAREPPLRKLFKYQGSPFWVADRGCKRDKSGQIFSFPWVDMGHLDITKVSP